MKIKKINIHGFKSFVDKVEFIFPPGTSAIIGPNGCGKSNVVDAIRWVLGEHNARNLRGKVMEDLIFNGSESRKSLGMAEVTLTLSNDGGLAPARYADFTDIEVKRRYYRSGDSEYYINKVACRLKDIVEFFTDTGLGTSAYSIIEQGQVSWLINAKPLERRVLIEEAAGINKYKQKKDASMSRLDATKLNLTRVSDIISEVKRQLNSLKRQANKALRYKKFKDELKNYDLYLANTEYRTLTASRASTEKTLTALGDDELKIIAKIDSLSAEVAGLRSEHLSKEDEYREIRERTESCESDLLARERESELLKVRTEGIEDNEARLTREGEGLKSQLKTLSKESALLALDHEKILANLQGLTTRLNEKTAELERLAREIRYKVELQDEKEGSALALSTRLTEIKHTILTFARDEESLKQKELDNASIRENTLRLIDEKKGPLEKLKQSISASDQQKVNIEAEITATTQDLKDLEDKNEAGETKLKVLKEDWALKSSKLHTLEEMEAEREGLDPAIRGLIKDGLPGNRKAVHGLVSDIIEAVPGYEKAIEAVLGDRLNYVIVEDQNTALAAIDHLTNTVHGRASFIPANEARLTTELNRTGPTGQATPLREMVKVKDGYAPIIDSLIGDAMLAEDLKDVMEAWNQNSMRSIFVTPNGHLLGDGVMTGGELDSSSSRSGGVLQKRRLIADIRADVEGLTQTTSTLELSLASIKEDINCARQGLESARRQLHQEDIGKINLANELQASSEELLRLEEREAEVSRAVTLTRAEITDNREQCCLLTKEKEELEEELHEIEEGISDLKKENTAIFNNKEGLSSLIIEMKVEKASLVEREDSWKNQLEEKDRAIRLTAERIEEKQEEIKNGITEKDRAQERINILKAELEGLLTKKDAIKGLEIRGREIIEAMGAKINNFDTELRSRRTDLSRIQGERGEKQVAFKELDLALQNLTEKMIEKYGLSIDGVAEDSYEEFKDMDQAQIETRAVELRTKIASLGDVSLSALDEFTELEERYTFLCTQRDDLNGSVEALLKTITKINRTSRERFKKTFYEINAKFQETFPKFFNGGKAELRLSDPDNILESGVEIVAQPPGKKLQNIMLLSGGEKALTATALIFAIFLIKPSPFCLLDEVDAPLDDANIERFNSFVDEMSNISQFLLITHNKRTMEVADTLYGITMEEPGVSKTVSVNF